MEICVLRDGSFDLVAGGMRLEGAYPAIDGVAIRPLRVETRRNGALYELTDGSLEIRIEREGEGLALTCKASGLDKAHDIAPIAHARVLGCDWAFVQGLGMGGPSGFSKLGEENLTSDSAVALGNEQGCVTLHAREQGKYRNVYRVSGGLLSAGFDTECVQRGGAELPTLYIREGRDFSSALRACAVEIAQTMHARPVQKQAFHWCSWYYLYHNLDQPILEEYLDGFQKHRGAAPFSHIQIDAGYFPACGDWLEHNERFPQGLKHAAETIKAAGYEPGVWIGPYMVGDCSTLYREHPDWLLKDVDGNFVHPWRNYNEPKTWGYRDSNYCVLDTSHPDAMAYLQNVFTTMRAWGYTLFKTDFLFWGLQDSSKVRRHTPGKTSFEYFRDTMKMIREAIGEDARWLGCISPFMPAIGFVDMMRIGGDVGAQWEERGFGPTNMLRELVADQYFNLVYWQNDPDAVMLRDFHIQLKTEQIEALALLEAMSGGAIYTSEPIHQIAPERLELLNFIRPKKLHLPEYPFWGEMRDEICVVQRLAHYKLIYFMNPTNKPILQAYNWKELLGEDVGFLFKWQGESARVEDVPHVLISPRSGVLYFATAEPLQAAPDNMWNE